ncbi:MAG: BCCT family transporter, partial [Ekhidna sp.]|nr:BCCT family transporter [Ekhidna sp.]
GFQNQLEDIITGFYYQITKHFGILYLWYATATLCFLIWLGFSRFGKIKLGAKDDLPEFKTVSWISMLFYTGLGAGLLYWGVLEWGYHLQAPALGGSLGSTGASELASIFGLFHWGPNAWAIFCLPTLAIAYPYYVRQAPQLRFSTAISNYLPKGANSNLGRFVDFLFMINLIAAVGTLLAFSTPTIAGAFARLLNLQHDFVLELSVIVLSIVVFGIGVIFGVQRGFKKLADFNIYLAFVLLFFVLALGPSLFILKMGTNSIGLFIQNFIRMNFHTDPIANTGFVEDWTVFYWAWWVAYAPFVGVIVTRISKGRTIRQVIAGMLLFGSLGAWMFFIVFGNYAMHLDITGAFNVVQTMDQGGRAAAGLISDVMLHLPFGILALILLVAISMIFLINTYDSTSASLSYASLRRVGGGEKSGHLNRIFWCLVLAILPVSLLFIEGGLKVISSMTVIVSLPLLFIGILMAKSLLKMIREDFDLKQVTK